MSLADFTSSLDPASHDGLFTILRADAVVPHGAHPDFANLIFLVLQAVLEVVCVSLPGYIFARRGQLDGTAQKVIANLNVNLFTPCLIFTKLASQLTLRKLPELAIIPAIFAVQTLVSYLSATAAAKFFRLPKRPRNFVVAMGVFGNSSSLPISLVISLAKTLPGLHWSRLPDDNDNDVAARGILYLLIFQQLGQLLRWSWGYHVLLAPPDKFARDEQRGRYLDDPTGEQRDLLGDAADLETAFPPKPSYPASDSAFGSGTVTPVDRRDSGASASGCSSEDEASDDPPPRAAREYSVGHLTHFPHPSTVDASPPAPHGWARRLSTTLSTHLRALFDALPRAVRAPLTLLARLARGVWAFMNPPLWAMLAALIVAASPALKRAVFGPDTLLSHTLTRAVAQGGQVAVPLILVVLGGNLARNTLPKDPDDLLELDAARDSASETRKLLIASLVSRMFLPTLLLAPLLALTARYVPVSILGDPVFVVVCFLLTGAPTALQLAQICQINGVYMGAMSRILFQSYVIWILPSTLTLVVMALEVVKWAAK